MWNQERDKNQLKGTNDLEVTGAFLDTLFQVNEVLCLSTEDTDSLTEFSLFCFVLKELLPIKFL